MIMTRYKYRSTPVLPWSPGGSDGYIADLSYFAGHEVVVSEKMDGENTTMYRDHIHARSIDSKHHPSRNWVKRLHGTLAYLIPQGWRLCGENMYAFHSIAYEQLDSYFYLFSMWDEHNRCLDWDEMLEWALLLDLQVPRTFYRGLWDEPLLRDLQFDTDVCEGYVVRTVKGFAYQEFAEHIAKWVRKGHVQTDTHWMHRAVVPNKLRLEIGG